MQHLGSKIDLGRLCTWQLWLSNMDDYVYGQRFVLTLQEGLLANSA